MLGVENLYDQRNLELTHQLNAALKAWHLFHKDQQYIVKDGEVVIVDEFTGRLMYGRRYSDGIHQAIEAKEGLQVRSEDQTLATITFQNYFRLYGKLAGMTGTAKTEEREFRDIYGLDVVVMPTNRSIARKDKPDIVYKHGEREVRSGRRRDHRRARKGPAGARRHALDREERNGWRCCAARRRVQRAQREVPRARSADHQGRGRVGRGHDRDQHGRPRRRHQARRGRGRERRLAHHRHRAPRVAAHRQPAARPRRPSRRSGFDALLHRARRRIDAPLRRRAHPGIMDFVVHRRDADRGRDDLALDRERAVEGREPQLRDPQVRFSSTTT
jgi:hypothetical protein